MTDRNDFGDAVTMLDDAVDRRVTALGRALDQWEQTQREMGRAALRTAAAWDEYARSGTGEGWAELRRCMRLDRELDLILRGEVSLLRHLLEDPVRPGFWEDGE